MSLLLYLILHTGAYNQPTVTNQYGNMGHGPILFYNRDEPYYEFTNFYPAPIDLDGMTWPTTEHYFQAQKFIGTSYPEVIRNFERPRQAFDLSRNPTVSRWRRKDWEDIKINIMRKALLAKFTQHKHLRQMLLSTGDRKLIEHTQYDKFWGDGGDGLGENHLGLLLMEIRHDLKTLQVRLRQQKTPVQPLAVNPDSHRERMQRSVSTEKDGQSSPSSSSSSSMDYTNEGADKSNQNEQNDQSHQKSANQDLTRRPLRSTATENTGSPPHQQLAATEDEGSPQGTPVSTTGTDTGTTPSQSNSELHCDPPVGNLIDLHDIEPLKEDNDNPMMANDVPPNLDEPLKPLPSTPAAGQCTTHAAQCTTQPPDTCTSTDSGKEPPLSNEDEEMDTSETNHIH